MTGHSKKGMDIGNFLQISHRLSLSTECLILLPSPFKIFFRKMKQDYLALETWVIRPLAMLIKYESSAFISYISLESVSF